MRMVWNGDDPVSFWVSTTVQPAQSPLTTQMDRKPFVILRWISADPQRLSHPILVTSTSPGGLSNVSNFGLAFAGLVRIVPAISHVDPDVELVARISTSDFSRARFLDLKPLAGKVVMEQKSSFVQISNSINMG